MKWHNMKSESDAPYATCAQGNSIHLLQHQLGRASIPTLIHIDCATKTMAQAPRPSRRTGFLVPLLAASLLAALAAQEVQGFAPTRQLAGHEQRARNTRPSILVVSAEGGGDEEPKLILDGGGAGVPGGGAADGPVDYLADYRAASDKRNEEAKQKLMEQVAREEEEARAREKAREEGNKDGGPNEANYGPGDLSTLPTVLTNDDSWEASLGDDDSGLMVAGGEGGGDADDGPGLYVPGEGDGDTPELFIPAESDGDGDSPIIL